jgi:hypothetical protein
VTWGTKKTMARMFQCESNSGHGDGTVEAVRIALIDLDVPSYSQSLEHLLRYCARPLFALERLSMIRRHRGSTGTSTTGCLPRITGSGKPSRRWRKGNIGKHGEDATGGHSVGGQSPSDCCDSQDKPRSRFWGPGDASTRRTRRTGRSPAREWRRKCHWPGYPSLETPPNAFSRGSLVHADTLAAMRTTLSSGSDRVLVESTSFSAGVMTNDHGVYGPAPDAFGHPGAGGSLAFAFIPSVMHSGVLPGPRTRRLIDAL